MAPRKLLRFPATTNPADSRRLRRSAYAFAVRVEMDPKPPGLPGSPAISRHAPPPITPLGPTADSFHAFTAGVRLHHLRKAGHPEFVFRGRIEFTYVAARTFGSGGFDREVTPASRSLTYMCGGHFTWLTPFIQQDRPGTDPLRVVPGAPKTLRHQRAVEPWRGSRMPLSLKRGKAKEKYF